MRRTFVALLSSAALVAGCDGAHHASGGAADAHDSAGGDAHGGAHAEARPLFAIMQDLGGRMTALTDGLMRGDDSAVVRHAEAIAAHAPIAPADLARIRRVLGAEWSEFERLDHATHEAAQRLAGAARGTDPLLVAAALAETQRGCVACHAAFRERLAAARRGGETRDSTAAR